MLFVNRILESFPDRWLKISVGRGIKAVIPTGLVHQRWHSKHSGSHYSTIIKIGYSAFQPLQRTYSWEDGWQLTVSFPIDMRLIYKILRYAVFIDAKLRALKVPRITDFLVDHTEKYLCALLNDHSIVIRNNKWFAAVNFGQRMSCPLRSQKN